MVSEQTEKILWVWSLTLWNLSLLWVNGYTVTFNCRIFTWKIWRIELNWCAVKKYCCCCCCFCQSKELQVWKIRGSPSWHLKCLLSSCFIHTKTTIGCVSPTCASTTPDRAGNTLMTSSRRKDQPTLKWWWLFSLITVFGSDALPW